jgi:iron complex outermembrane recepter protein
MREVILACFLLSHAVTAQHTIRCTVYDKDAGNGLGDVFVFLPEIHRGSSTDENGIVVIAGIASEHVLVEISHVGYRTAFKHVQLPKDSIFQVALQRSLVAMEEVVITGNRLQPRDESVFNIDQVGLNRIQRSGSFSLADAISKLPGINQLSTGPGISKPVIRGLYGNRIQVTLNGIRFDNQQWQDEHGLGLSDVGVDRVDIIRGPASVLYGSDAVGGVVNIIDERPAALNKTVDDFTTKLYTNTYGIGLNYGHSRSLENHWRKFRVGMENHADYSDGDGKRILNSRFATYNVKMTWGKSKDNRVRVNGLTLSHSMFGFVFDSLNRKTEDERLSRSFDGPHHGVSFLQLTTENIIYRHNAEIKIKGGFISNLRLEDEGGGGISLSMLLNTINGVGQITRRFSQRYDLTAGVSTFFQTNTNFGGRIIIPDAITGEASLFSFCKRQFSNLILEGGLRYDARYIETFPTQNLNVIGNESPTEEIVPFGKLYHALNFSLGGILSITDDFRLKGNASTGFRPGNLAELSSNGLHEGTLRWEIGTPQAKLERNLNLEGTLGYYTPTLRTAISIYRNAFQNFFFLAPDGSEFFGFQVYHFRQRDAQLRGGEMSVEWSAPSTGITLEGSYSFIDAIMDNGDHLPFIPANRVNSEARIDLSSWGPFFNPSISIGGNYAFGQNRPAEFETKTPDYFLVNSSISAHWHKVRLSLNAANIMNEKYVDHLSRYKYYGIGNMGRSIVLVVNFTF